MESSNVIREEMNEILLKELRKTHEMLMNDLSEEKTMNELTVELINLHIRLASHIIKEVRSLNGENAYLI